MSENLTGKSNGSANSEQRAADKNTSIAEDIKTQLEDDDNNNNKETTTASPNKKNDETESKTENEDSEIVLLRQDPKTKKRVLNKSAYAKLQRNFSNRRSIDVIKVKYENLPDDGVDNPFSKTSDPKKLKPSVNLRRSYNVKHDKEIADRIKNKYSAKLSEYPVAKPRRESGKHRHSAPIIKYEDSKESDNEPEEFINVVSSHSKSRESVDQIQYELDQYVQMEVKERKRSNSFRRLFSFGKDKKKKDENGKAKNKNRNLNENRIQNENRNQNQNENEVVLVQNESNSFNRHVNYRQSANGSIRSRDHHQVLNRSNSDDSKRADAKQLEEKYAQLHISQFNKTKQAFQQAEEYVDMDNKAKSQATYINVPYVQKFIDSSSSNNSSLSEKPNNFDNAVSDSANNSLNFSRFHNGNSGKRETPPRAQETRLDVKLVSPKKIDFLHNSLQREQKPQLEETYGTVFDSVENNKRPLRNNLSLPPKPVSFEQTKLKLPPNRDIYTPSPRVKSPIPAHKVSTEKLIATELLKSPKSPTASKRIYDSPPSHQSLEIDIDYPDNINKLNTDTGFSPINKPPKPARPELKKLHIPSPTFATQQTSNNINNNNNINKETIVTNAVIHNHNHNENQNLPPNYVNQTQYSNNLLKIRPPSPSPNTQMSPSRLSSNSYYGNPNASLNNININLANRCTTPTNRGPSPGVASSPQKEEMRRSVEAYCWRELKKMKEQETQDLYSYQVQYGYVEDPVMYRRGRSESPTRGSRGRRSLSLPRDPRVPQPVVQYVQGASGRTYIMQANAIPEGRAILNQIPAGEGAPHISGAPMGVSSSYFVRASPERRTVDGSRNLYENYKSNSLYRPIFKRGSLTKQPEEMQGGNKKVSFVNSQADQGQSWPTRNGFTQSPPQRRMDRVEASPVDDEVFLPNIPTSHYGYSNQPNIGYNIKIREPTYMSKTEVLRQQDDIYGQPVDYIPRQSLVRRASISSNDPIYGGVQTRQYYQPRRREIIVNEDEIFGQIGGYQNPAYRAINEQYYDPRSSQNSLYAPRASIGSIYGKQVAVHNKVCDMYGQIHDPNENLYGKIEKQGVLMGQLQNSPAMARHQIQNNPTQFVRNSRLTASANDMYRQYRSEPRYQSDNFASHVNNSPAYYAETKAPTRPLPPLPNGKKAVNRNGSEPEHFPPNNQSPKMPNTKNAKSKKSSFFGKSK